MMPKEKLHSQSEDQSRLEAIIQDVLARDETLSYEDAKQIAEMSLRSHKHEEEELNGPHRTEALERKNPNLR